MTALPGPLGGLVRRWHARAGRGHPLRAPAIVADASHQLRAPLAVMRAELDLGLRDELVSAGARPVFESLEEEVERMERIIDDLLTLAQAEEGRLPLAPARIELVDAIEAAARPLRPLADAKDLSLEVADGSWPAQADPHLLHQALTNLIENAIKFGTPGGAVRVSAWEGGGEVGVTVLDDGPGIAAGDHAQIFERYYRAEQPAGETVRGSGLGLAICQEIATAHGGRLWVDSQEGRGSAFSLALPASSS